MNAKRTKPDIDKVIADGRLIDEAIREGVHRALLEHKRRQSRCCMAGWQGGHAETGSDPGLIRATTDLLL